MAQYFVDLYLWEALLNSNPQLRGIVEIGTWHGGMSRYLYAQAEARGLFFATFDSMVPESPPPCFEKTDVFRYPFKVVEAAGEDPVALFCDGGNKPRELKTFAPLMPEGSIIIVHDWGKETLASDVPVYVEEIYGDFCDEIGSASRVFRMVTKEAK